MLHKRKSGISLKRRIYMYFLRHHRDKLFTNGRMFHNDTRQNDKEFLDLYQQVFVDSKIPGYTIREIYNIFSAVRKTGKTDGDLAEVGVYRGGSAKILYLAKGEKKKLHLYDTFEGMPEPDLNVDVIKKGDLADTSLEVVKEYLGVPIDIVYHKGFFPETAVNEMSTTFSFVHLDCNLYKSTKDALSFFYPRLVPRGMLISHDYRSINTPGVTKAFDAFFAGKPETVIEIWDSQALVVKL